MCNCNKSNCYQCKCNSYCKSILPAKCVNNKEILSFLKGTTITNLQTLLLTINNSLKSISNLPCVTYTRIVDPVTKIATYQHIIDWECAAEYICNVCNNPCNCTAPSSLTVVFDGTGFSDPSLFRALLSWIPSSDAISYRIEYKKSTELEWSLVSPSHPSSTYDSLIIDIEGEELYGYDFRVRANCDGCESNYIYTTITSEECQAPTNVTWHQDDIELTWNSQTAVPPSNFEIRYKLKSSSTWITVTVPITEESPGYYSANFISVDFTPNRLYDFSVVKLCGTSRSAIGTGCAQECSVPLQSNPSVAVEGTTAVITWPFIPDIYGFNIHIYNVTDSVDVITPTFVGTDGFYEIEDLPDGKQYTVTITALCSEEITNCEGRTTEFEIEDIPDFNIYIAKRYTCGEDGCTEQENLSVQVPYPTTLTIGGFYQNTLGDSNIYEILSTTTGIASININTDTFAASCAEICPPQFKWYLANQYTCVEGVCTLYDSNVVVKCSYTDTLTIGSYYKDIADSVYIYEILSTTTIATAIDINVSSASLTCNSFCPPPPNNYYNATVMECAPTQPPGCIETPDTEIVYVVYPNTLVIGQIYKDFGDVMYRIDSITAETTAILVDHTITIDCEEECADPYLYYNATIYNCEPQCTASGSDIVRSLVPLTIGKHYVDSINSGINYLIISSTLTPSIIDILPTAFDSCADACE